LNVKCEFKKSGFQHQEDGMKLGNEERSVVELREHRKFRLNSIFDVEHAFCICFVIKSGLFEQPR